MKRALLLLLIARAALAEPTSNPFEGKPRPVPSDMTMSAEEVTRYALPYLHRVTACYKRNAANDRRATGDLFLYVVISRAGSVVYHETTAPGVGLLSFIKLDRCLRREIATWHFPPRRGFTNAVIPYRFFVAERTPPRIL